MQIETERRPPVDSGTKLPATSHPASVLAHGEHMPNDLCWQEFSTARFPGRRRHDLEALTAYGAYRRSGAVEARASRAPCSGEPARVETERGLAGRVALDDWEDEGGAV